MAMRATTTASVSVLVSTILLVTTFAGVGAASSLSHSVNLPQLVPTARGPPGTATPGAPPNPFAFVSNFENNSTDGWKSIRGATPVVVSAPNYSGEPSYASNAKTGVQIDYASKGILTGDANVSLHVALDAPATGIGYFGLATSGHALVALVGVSDGNVVAGSGLDNISTVEAVPNDTAQPAGWVLVIADITTTSTGSSMKVFVDQTQAIDATINIPNALTYSGVAIRTVHGTVHYSDIIASTYKMATRVPGYNNMEGYGQGSGLLVTRLPAFANYTATMTLKNWSVPQSGILSFQINAMNLTGTTESTCDGFFQLGMSLDTGGKISPWYVPGVNCESTNFVGAVATPANSVLVLTILYEASSHKIRFSIDDTTIGTTWTHSIAYSGGAFYGAYTQMEFQPCCNSSPIGDYVLSGELSDMMITRVSGPVEPLTPNYMLPFMLDAPVSWQLGFYQSASAAYDETS
jgi:hypothetical protein